MQTKERLYWRNRIRRIVFSTPGIVLMVTIVMTLIVHFLTGNFYTPYMIETFLRQVSFNIMIGFAMTLVLLIGDIDLSVASVAALGAMFMSILLMRGVNTFLAILIGLLVGAGCGFINGILRVKLNLVSFIVTLATEQIFRGIVYVITKGKPITGLPAYATRIGQEAVSIIPNTIIFAGIICAILVVVLRFLPFGRHVYAVGGNISAAKIIGIRVGTIQIAVFVIVGILSSFTGMLMALRLGTFQANVGENWPMNAVTAAVLGGTAMTGGVGNPIGTVCGGLLIGTINYALGLLSVSAYWQSIVLGVVVIVAISIDAISKRRRVSV